MRSPQPRLIVVGGGQAGLAAAHIATRRHGLDVTVLDAAPKPGGSWPHYYDSLTLFSPARFSHLPGRAFPGDPDHYPHRDEVIAYLRDYAATLDADLHYDTEVTHVTPTADGFTVTTATGDQHQAPLVIAATGNFARPHRPDLPGLDTFTGTVLHSREYHTPGPYAGQRIIVVGGGNSAVQIAAELAGHAHVTITTRTPIRFRPAIIGGRDIHWWLARTGLDTAPITPLLHRIPPQVSDDGRYRGAIAAGRPDHRPLFTRLWPDAVEWSDGTREHVDTVILATGYRPNLDTLHGTGALTSTGEPHHRAGVSTTVPGLGYVGLQFQRNFSSATLRGVGRDAHHVLTRLKTEA